MTRTVSATTEERQRYSTLTQQKLHYHPNPLPCQAGILPPRRLFGRPRRSLHPAAGNPASLRLRPGRPPPPGTVRRTPQPLPAWPARYVTVSDRTSTGVLTVARAGPSDDPGIKYQH
eukprot:763994-Hanusia_phi.AAC.5